MASASESKEGKITPRDVTTAYLSGLGTLMHTYQRGALGFHCSFVAPVSCLPRSVAARESSPRLVVNIGMPVGYPLLFFTFQVQNLEVQKATPCMFYLTLDGLAPQHLFPGSFTNGDSFDIGCVIDPEAAASQPVPCARVQCKAWDGDTQTSGVQFLTNAVTTVVFRSSSGADVTSTSLLVSGFFVYKPKAVPEPVVAAPIPAPVPEEPKRKSPRRKTQEPSSEAKPVNKPVRAKRRTQKQ